MLLLPHTKRILLLRHQQRAREPDRVAVRVQRVAGAAPALRGEEGVRVHRGALGAAGVVRWDGG